jgi:tryptophan synthase alpha chain
MSYLNPLLAFGLDRLGAAALEAGVCGFIVPDLPFEESQALRDALAPHGLGLVQLVTPATPADRLETLCAESRGFVYAVTITGITGGGAGLPDEVTDYLEGVREVSPLPVCAGFGIRSRDDVARLSGAADGVIVGSALVEVLERGDDPGAFLAALRAP